MDIASHLEKLKRFEHARGKLDPLTEFEMWYWMSLCGGTSAINAALHGAKLTGDGDYFSTQSVDVYMHGGKHDQAASWKPTFMWDVDLIHIHMPEISKPLTPKLKQAYQAIRRSPRRLFVMSSVPTAARSLCAKRSSTNLRRAANPQRGPRARWHALHLPVPPVRRRSRGNANDARTSYRQGDKDHPRHAPFHGQ
jgi:hypothetical protein